MTAWTDHELLRAYGTEGSEAAFAELVRRHAAAVQAAACRQTGNAGLAEEVTHAVFLQLARKAVTLRPQVILLGWLLRAARYAAIDAVRVEARRRKRDAEFLAMQSLEDPSPADDSATLWARVAPLLDEALHRLREKDRNALLLRFFENKPLAAVGVALGVPEDTARKRVHRALERLQSHLLRRGAVAPSAMLPGLLSARAVPVPDPALVSATTRTALMGSKGSPSAGHALALALGRRLFWASIRPWLAAASLFAVSAGGITIMRHAANGRSQTAAVIDDNYRPAGFPDARTVQGFVAALQQRLAANERADVARMMLYPLRVNSPEGTLYVQDQEDLLGRYEAVFRPTVIGNILKSPNRRLFCNRQGVMVGNGTVWIAPETPSETAVPRVIALNLP